MGGDRGDGCGCRGVLPFALYVGLVYFLGAVTGYALAKSVAAGVR